VAPLTTPRAPPRSLPTSDSTVPNKSNPIFI
jgi:hypothetical protein